MTSIIERTRLIEVLTPIFEKINNENWNQDIGLISLSDITSENTIKPGVKCCVGCHIAVHMHNAIFSKPLKDIPRVHYLKINYLSGQEYVLSIMREVYPQMTHRMMCDIFRCAGCGTSPFSWESWKRHPMDVLENMKYIENLPPDLSRINRVFHLYYICHLLPEWYKTEQSRIKKGRELANDSGRMVFAEPANSR